MPRRKANEKTRQRGDIFELCCCSLPFVSAHSVSARRAVRMDAGLLASQLDEFRQVLAGINEDVSSCRGSPGAIPSVCALTPHNMFSKNIFRKGQSRHSHTTHALRTSHAPTHTHARLSTFCVSRRHPPRDAPFAAPGWRLHTRIMCLLCRRRHTPLPHSIQKAESNNNSTPSAKKTKNNSSTIPPRSSSA